MNPAPANPPPRSARTRRAPKANGLLFINKPIGITSHDVIRRVRRCLGFRKIGHLGTLDPIADGILPLALGYATRLASLLIRHDKVYAAVFRLGVETDTHDRTGKVTAEHPLPESLDEETLRRHLESFVGDIDQVPPLISAKKYHGKPLYYWIRRGVSVPAPEPKRVTFHAIDLVGFEPPLVHLRIHCSAGAYIRGLARDLGRALGCGAVVDRIRRERWHRYTLDDCIDLETFARDPRLEPPHFIPLARIEPEWPVLHAGEATVRHLLQGRAIALGTLLRRFESPEQLLTASHVKVISPSGRLVAVARVEYPHRLVPDINIPQLWNPAEESNHERP